MLVLCLCCEENKQTFCSPGETLARILSSAHKWKRSSNAPFCLCLLGPPSSHNHSWLRRCFRAAVALLLFASEEEKPPGQRPASRVRLEPGNNNTLIRLDVFFMNKINTLSLGKHCYQLFFKHSSGVSGLSLQIMTLPNSLVSYLHVKGSTVKLAKIQNIQNFAYKLHKLN